jgi:hypothetical protein
VNARSAGEVQGTLTYGDAELDLFADELLTDDLIVEELADSSALGTWTSAACFGSACGTAGTGSSIACKS